MSIQAQYITQQGNKALQDVNHISSPAEGWLWQVGVSGCIRLWPNSQQSKFVQVLTLDQTAQWPLIVKAAQRIEIHVNLQSAKSSVVKSDLEQQLKNLKDVRSICFVETSGCADHRVIEQLIKVIKKRLPFIDLSVRIENCYQVAMEQYQYLLKCGVEHFDCDFSGLGVNLCDWIFYLQGCGYCHNLDFSSLLQLAEQQDAKGQLSLSLS